MPDGMYHPGENRGYFKETDRTTGRDKKAETQDINDVHLRDKDSLYENDDEASVVTMYLTVSRGNSSEGTAHTWKEINSYSAYDYDKMGVERYQTAALFRLVMSQVAERGGWIW